MFENLKASSDIKAVTITIGRAFQRHIVDILMGMEPAPGGSMWLSYLSADVSMRLQHPR